MAIVEHRPETSDLLDLTDVQLLQRGPLMDEIYDPNSPKYRPDLVPRDPDTGQPLMDSLYDPASPDYRPDLEPGNRSMWDVATNDWMLSKIGDIAIKKSFEEDPDFEHPWSALPPQYDDYADDFAETGSLEEWNYLKFAIDRSLQDKQRLQQAGFKDGLAYFAIQMLDPALLPLYFINFGVAVKGGGGLALGKAAGKFGGYTAAEATGIEMALQYADPTRTAGESITSIAAAGLMGSIFGMAGQGVVNAMGKRGMVKVREEAAQILEDGMKVRRAQDQSQGVGAAAHTTTLADETPIRNPTKGITVRSPTYRLIYDNVSAAASRAVDRLVPHNVLKRKHLKGVASDDTPLYAAINQVREHNTAEMITGIAKARRALRKRGVRLSRDEVASMVGKAARRGDTHEHAEITALANDFRRIVDDWGQRAKKVGLITDEALEGIASYFPRLYDVRAISRNFGRWREVLGKHFQEKYPELLDEELDEIAASIHNTLMNNGVGKTWSGGFSVPPKALKSGHFKGRTLDISDLELEEFLVDDVRYVTQHYFRSVAPGVLAREMFGADNIEMLEGAPVIRSILNEMDEEYKLAKLRLSDQGKSTLKLDKQWERAQKDMRYLMATVMGHISPTQSYLRGGFQVAGQELRSFTAAAALGQMALSAIPDMANLVLSHGLVNLFRSVPAILTPRKLSNSAKVDFDAIAIGLDTIMSTRMLRMADLEERHFNAFTRGMGGQATANFAFKAFGANLWNSWMKRAAATAGQNRLLADAMRYDKLGKLRKARLAQLGVDAATARKFASNFSKQSTKKRQGVNWADLDNWDDEAASKFERILYRDAETTIVTPQAGDMPRILDNEAGLLFAQFKRFVMSHQLQIMTQASQRLAAGDLSVMNYVVAGAGLAMFSHYMRVQAKNGYDQDAVNEELSQMTVADWVFHAVDRGAMLSFGTDLLMGIDGLTDGNTGQMLGFSDRGRYVQRGLGFEQRVPGLGTLARAYRGIDAGVDAVTGEAQFNQRDLANIRRMLPLQNLFYLSWLLDQVEDKTAKEFSLPETSRRRSGQRKRYRN